VKRRYYLKIAIQRVHVRYQAMCTYVAEFVEAKIFPPSSSDLNLVNFLLWGALQHRFYRQEIRDVDYMKHVLLHC